MTFDELAMNNNKDDGGAKRYDYLIKNSLRCASKNQSILGHLLGRFSDFPFSFTSYEMTRFASKLYSLLFLLTLTITSTTGYTFFGIPSAFLSKRSVSAAMRLSAFRHHPISNPVQPPRQASTSTSLNYLNGDEAISANSSNMTK